MFTFEQLKYSATRIRQRLASNQLGQTFVVLGSAPNPTLIDKHLKEAKLVCVNASGYCAAKLGLPTPDVTVMSGYMVQDTEDAVKVATKESIRNLKTSELVWIERGVHFTEAQGRLAALGYQYQYLQLIDHEQRAKIICAVTGESLGEASGDKKVSTGLFAASLAFYRGASQVVLAGISLNAGGYEYCSSERPRKHVTADSRAIAAMKRLGLPIKTSEPGLAMATGIELV